MELPLKNVQNSGGKYALFFMLPNGNWSRVEKTGLAIQPFQVVATFDTRPYVAVQKIGNVRNANDVRLFLINLNNGCVVDGCDFGASRIVFDNKNKSIFFTPLASNGVPAQKYSWCLPRGAGAYMALNVPSKLEPGISSLAAGVALHPVMKIDVIEFVPRTSRVPKKTDAPKRGRGRPRGSKNKPRELPLLSNTPKRKRGRPLGSKNKPKPTPVATPQIRAPQIHKNVVSLRNTRRNTLGGVYDVYINGVRVATKRMNAVAKTFMNNRILAVSYQVPAGLTQNYDVFWPNGAGYYIGATHRLTGKPITINSVSENNGELKLGLSNRAVRTIRENDLARFAPQQFVLDEKQR